MASATVVPAVAVVALLAIACGARTDLETPCDAAALAYCEANGCPMAGPSQGTEAALGAWCIASPQFAASVTGVGTCITPAGTTWAIDVKTTDAAGDDVYLLYDPSTGQLIGVSTRAPGDAGTDEHDYGACDEGLGLISCTTTLVTCAE
jgi:hypothetical protein